MRKRELCILIDPKNESIQKEEEKCILCGLCKKVCENEMLVIKNLALPKKKSIVCIRCGQCANICPTEAIKERMDYQKIQKMREEANKTIVISVAPAVRASLGEAFGMEVGTNVEGKIVTALKKLGANYVFDLTFGADLTVMEEAMELVTRMKQKKDIPLFTSCCPAWVNYVERFYPTLLPYLSTTKSPVSIQGATVKTYFAKKANINPENIVNIVVVPCTAKKYEIKREELSVASSYHQIEKKQDNDYVITTRELAKWIQEEKIDFTSLEDGKFDSPLGRGSGSGVIFGNTGGVAEAILRTSYFFLTGKDLAKDKLVFEEVRGIQGIKKAKIHIEGRNLQIAVVNGIKNAKEILKQLQRGECPYHLIEVMTCVGGCIAGGGQPKSTMLQLQKTKLSRMQTLYVEERELSKRLSYQNPEIKQIYQEFYEKPNSKIAKEILHTKYQDRSNELRK